MLEKTEEQLADEVVDEVLDEEAWAELDGLRPAARAMHDSMRWQLDHEWLRPGSPELRAAALLLGLYLRDQKREHYYELGNALRGWFSGKFSSDQQAWTELSDRFNRGFPSRGGRHVQMTKTIRYGRTAGGNESEADRKWREGWEAENRQEEQCPKSD